MECTDAEAVALLQEQDYVRAIINNKARTRNEIKLLRPYSSLSSADLEKILSTRDIILDGRPKGTYAQ